MRRALVIGIVVLVLLVGVFLFTPPYDPVSPRQAAAVILISFGGAKVSIANYGERRSTLVGSGNGLHVETSTHELGLNGAVISPGGVLIGYNEHFGVAVVLQPRLENGKVKWKCSVLPYSASPVTCRS
jgi:hypothetical protein